MVEQDEDVTLKLSQQSGTGYSWISNFNESGETVSLVRRWTESVGGMMGGPKDDFWKVHGLKEGSELVRMAYA